MAKKGKSSGGSGTGTVRAIGFAAVAVIAGALSLFVLYTMIDSYRLQIAEAKKPEDKVMVIVSARDLYQGVTITEEDLYAVEIPPRFLPENVFLSPEHVVGRIPRERILANEFVRSDRLADPESGIGLNAVIPRGMRAISVDIQGGQALSGFLNPTNYVDILVTIEPTESDGTPVTETVLQAIFVLGVNSRASGESTEDAAKRGKQKPTVTFLVTADQAEKVAYGEVLGDIRLALRNDLDVDFAETQGITSLDVLRRQLEIKTVVRKRKPVVKKEETGIIKIIRGDQVTEETFGADGQIKR
ncbi:MAG: Flp pilus assembly protein CpaB [Rhodobacterales bacterium]|nr:Flp pilus assembly protein CpaB [Rhodobacterales bacterium]